MKISEPEYIGNLRIRNRVVMAPMISNLSDPSGLTNENHIAYLEERAKGGAGLIITEYSYINSLNSRGSRNELGFHNSDFTPKLRRLTERIHMHEAAIFAQLVHAGGKAFLDTNRAGPMAPSAVDYVGYTPKEMTASDIESVIKDFESASKVVKASNFDGIEIHGAHGYLVQEFLSPALNRRTDRYGGSFENRIRFAQEIIDAIRSSVDLTLGIRLSLYEDDADGYGPDYGLKVAENLHGIDYVHFSAGRFAPPGSSSSFYSPKTHIANRLPRKPAIKTIVVGSVTSLEDAERVLEKADFVSVGRALLADPYFPRKIMTAPDTLRPCIRCNQACRDLSFGEVRCTVNPDTGLEFVRRPLPRLNGDIAVVGGGIKGMECALNAAKSGLKVTLYDDHPVLGGQLASIFDEEKRTEFQRMIGYYSRILPRLGVVLNLGERFTGKGLYCLPDRIYGHIPDKPDLLIDSNIYQHHDEALSAARTSSVTMTERSLSSLDRVRQESFRRLAEKSGIKFVKSADRKPDVSVIERWQYDIRAAMVSGREVFRKYAEERIQDFL